MANVETVLDAYRWDVAEEILVKVFKAAEETRLNCEFQVGIEYLLIDVSDLVGEFTYGKLLEIAKEYGVDLLKNNSVKNYLQEAEK